MPTAASLARQGVCHDARRVHVEAMLALIGDPAHAVLLLAGDAALGDLLRCGLVELGGAAI
jgi:2-keto-4-pentenoate hydratase